MSNDDTIFAPATPSGSGAVSIIRISGAGSFALADRIVRLRKGSVSETAGYSIRYGSIPGLDEVLVSVFRAPRSYTGEDSVEISCHASPYIVQKLLQMLSDEGGRLAEPGEFTRRAFLNGKMDLAQAEAVADLIAADSQAAHSIAVNQLKGTYSEELRTIRDRLLELASLLELELDFSEEEVEFANRSQLRTLLDAAVKHITKLTDSFRLGNAIRNGVPVAIVGDVNSGKSTLLNALLGDDRAIVSDIPGTTRDTVEDCVTIGGVIFRFIDTAGIRDASDSIEKKGIERSFAAIDKAHTVIVVLDGTRTPAELEISVRTIMQRLAASPAPGRRLILVRNKTDLPRASVSAGFSPELQDGASVTLLDISAKEGSGLEALRAVLSEGINSTASGSTLVSNIRHYEALCAARDNLSRVSRGLDDSLPAEFIAEDLRCAIADLGSIFGEISTDEVLGRIFERFCIGK